MVLGAFDIDTTPPTDPTNVASTSHTVGTPSNDNTIDISWTVGTDPAGSGVNGYDTAFNNTSTATCSQSKDLEEGATGTTSDALADGSWYFHVCTVDNTGNWTSTVVLGAFDIDTTPPNDPTNVVSNSHTVGTPSNDNTIDIAWEVGTDPGGSGVDGYDTAFNNTSTPTCSQSKDLEEGATGTTSSALGDDSWYFHVCTVDKAGNWTSTVVLGGFVIDTTPPVITLGGSDPAFVLINGTYTDAGATAFDIVAPNVTVVTGGLPIDTSVLGSNTFTYDAADSANNQAIQVTRTVIVELPEVAIARIIGTILGPRGIQVALSAKLDAALASLDKGKKNNQKTATNNMNAFINFVNAQRGKWINNQDADDLITDAGAFINSI